MTLTHSEKSGLRELFVDTFGNQGLDDLAHKVFQNLNRRFGDNR